MADTKVPEIKKGPEGQPETIDWQQRSDQILQQLFAPDLLTDVKAGGEKADKIWTTENDRIVQAVKNNPALRKSMDEFIQNAPEGNVFKTRFSEIITKILDEKKDTTLSGQASDRKSFLSGMLATFSQNFSPRGAAAGTDAAPGGAGAVPGPGGAASSSTTAPGSGSNPATANPATKKGPDVPVGGWTAEQLKQMSTGDIFANIIKLVEKVTKLAKGAIPEATAKLGLNLSKDDVAKMKIDLNKEAATKFSQADSYNYAAAVLGLDLSKKRITNIAEFLNVLKGTPDFVLEEDKAKITEAKPGDVIFFTKKNDRNENEIYLTGVISNIQPLKMKTVPAGGGEPREIDLANYEDYNNGNFMGFVKIPQNHKQEVPAQNPSTANPAPAANPTGIPPGSETPVKKPVASSGAPAGPENKPDGPAPAAEQPAVVKPDADVAAPPAAPIVSPTPTPQNPSAEAVVENPPTSP